MLFLYGFKEAEKRDFSKKRQVKKRGFIKLRQAKNSNRTGQRARKAPELYKQNAAGVRKEGIC